MLAQSTGLLLLGVVTWNKTAEETHSERWRLAGFATCVACLLFVLPGLLWFPGWSYDDLEPLMSTIEKKPSVVWGQIKPKPRWSHCVIP